MATVLIDKAKASRRVSGNFVVLKGDTLQEALERPSTIAHKRDSFAEAGDEETKESAGPTPEARRAGYLDKLPRPGALAGYQRRSRAPRGERGSLRRRKSHAAAAASPRPVRGGADD